ncbi:hypothetical protein PMM47T1_16555 [Pseudomonas sp. M47T1]|uniref:type VI secretion system baseplate subunit TssG n=1 Tax=Pseudomonas sp. M47T1 TaxID=1179778 RepID=UPI0002608855|nr:type VI secretion system baseplate subunit TssG [Pseudomonas sp. M47T1]EIK95418.1 hypothetical protein PMM47T1_16555 [Pseudomonas sp. M47T1]
MATGSREAADAVSLRLRQTPQAFEFLQALLILEQERPNAEALGTGTAPHAEALRLRGPLTPVFAPSEVQRLEQTDDQPPVMTSPIFGLGGPDGPLPYAYQEWLQQRARLKDDAPAAFLDLFQHRLLSLLYRVMRKHRVAIGFTPPDASPVQRQLRALTGLLPHTLQERQALPDAAVLARSALFAGGRRSLAGFAAIVRQHFGLCAAAHAYEGAWRQVPVASRSVLKVGARNLTLGRTAVAGTWVWDEHAGVRLELGPLSREQSRRFLPGAPSHLELADLHALYFGPDLDCTLVLRVRGRVPLILGLAHLRWGGGLLREADGEEEQLTLTLHGTPTWN